MTRVRAVWLPAVAVTMCMTMSVAADPFSVNRTGLELGLGWTQVSVNNGAAITTDAGLYNVTVYGTDAGDRITDGVYQVFCIDLWNSVNEGVDLYSDVPLDAAPDHYLAGMGTVRAGRMAYLMDNYWNDTYLGSNVVSRNSNAAALQFAIWEIVAEPETGDYDLSNGDFAIIDPSRPSYWARTIAQSWLTEMGDKTSSFANYIALTSEDAGTNAQDYVVRVPVPGAVLLGVLGLVYAGMKLRRTCD